MTVNDTKINKLLKIPVYLTIILIISKFFVYLSSGSIAIFSLFTDSFFDFLSSFISLIAYKYSIKDKTEKYQYGFYGIIDLATIIISSLIIITVVFIYYRSIYNILNKNVLIYDNYAIIVMLLSTIISLGLSIVLKSAYKHTKLLVIKGEIAHYIADGFTNGGVLISIVICRFIYNSYLIDPIIAMIMGYYVAKPAIEIFIDAINNILSKEIDNEIKDKVVNIINTKENIIGYHNFKTRRSGERIFIQIYLEINKDLTFEKAHNIVEEIEQDIEKTIENSEIIVHACPR